MDQEVSSLSSLPQGYKAVVIGATGGLGAALCARLVADPRLGDLISLSRRENGLDITDEASVAAQAEALAGSPIHLLICATGILTIDGRAPEKSLKQIDADVMLEQFRVNALGPALIAKHFLPWLDRKARSAACFISARVGSIGDNRLGGWIAYRAAKAALNQIMRTASIEMARTHPEAVIVSMHPGTVATRLSAPYSQGHASQAPDEAAARIVATLDGLSPADTGSFRAYDGSAIDW